MIAPSSIVGVDPGLSGAIAVLGLDGQLTITDMPTVTVQRKGRDKREIDPAALAAIIRGVTAPAVTWIERVGAIPGQGVSSMFAFGRAVGVVEGVLAASGVPVSYVAPAVWKRALHVPSGKDGARLRASQLLPAYAAEWRRARDDGGAEAALIALYGLGRTCVEKTDQERIHG